MAATGFLASAAGFLASTLGSASPDGLLGAAACTLLPTYEASKTRSARLFVHNMSMTSLVCDYVVLCRTETVAGELLVWHT